MNQNKIFHLTRWRLASWYAVVMGFILSLCGLVAYNTVAHAYWMALERELKSVAGTLHDGIEPQLKEPGRLEASVQQLMPDVCVAGTKCLSQTATKRHVLGVFNQGNYYMRLLDSSGHLIALAGFHPNSLSPALKKELWQTLSDSKGHRYRQISLAVHTRNYIPWGYMQVGRSLKDFDDYLATLKWNLLLALPVVIGLICVASWWLAGLAMQPIRQSYQLLHQFTSDAAHELRTPLAALQATIEAMLSVQKPYENQALDGPDCFLTPTLETRDVQQTIERQFHRLSQLVQDLLLLCRMDQQVVLPQRQPCCLNDIVSDLVEEFEDLAKASDIFITTNVCNSQSLYVMGNVEQLYRLVFNLIANAIQFTPTGGRVNVILENSDKHALIQVQDTGIGIAPQDQSRIFERFYRVSSERSRSSGGSGLGLAIAQAIVQAHSGSLLLHSDLGRGSTFTIQLPLGDKLFSI